MAQRRWFGRLVRGFLAAAGVVVICVALALGALRIAAMQLPSYQTQIERALGEALGLNLGFERMDARFGLHGPELTFHAATVSALDEDEPFLSAARAAVVLDAWALVARRELRAKRLTLDGTGLTLLRADDGKLSLERAPDGDGTTNLDALLPPELEIAVRGSTVRYVDARRGVDWTFENLEIDLRRGGGTIELDARARPPSSVAESVDVAVQGDYRRGGGWRVFGEVVRADLAAIGDALPEMRGWPRRGGGDVSVWIEWHEGALARGMVDATLADVAWAEAGAAVYDRAAGAVEWTRTSEGWRLVLNDIELDREGRRWPLDADAIVEVSAGRAGPVEISASGTFVRLEDLAPIVAALRPEQPSAARWLELAPRGEIRNFDVRWRNEPSGSAYEISGDFDGLGVDHAGRWPGFDGLSGTVRADSDSGRLSLETRGGSLEWPSLFRSAIEIEELSGLVVWREGADGIRLVGDDLVLASPDVRTRSSLELTLPLDGGSPVIDLETHADAFQAAVALRYLPTRKMPRRAVEWLDGAIRGGRVVDAGLEFVGPLAAFPFDGGEGTFRVTASVEGGVLRYVGDWPAAENLDGTLEFSGAAFRARGAGRVLAQAADDVRVEIADLRRPTLTLETETNGPLADVLAFLRGAPPIAAKLGPGYERLRAPAGTGSVSLELGLPLLDMPAYRLDATLSIDGGVLAIDGFAPQASDVRGVLELANGAVSSERLEGTFLDGPAAARVSPAGRDGYRTRLELDGEVTAGAVVDAFGLPFRDRVAGQTRWSGSVLLPESAGERLAAPLRVAVRSNLSGVALNLPQPLRKDASEPTSLQLDFTLGGGRLDVTGNLGATRRFVMGFETRGNGFELDSGALAFGGDLAAEPIADGLGIYGSVPRLDFDAWTALVRSPAPSRGGERATSVLGDRFAEARLEIADLTALGQPIGAAQLDVRRGDAEWRIEIDSAPVSGLVRVPRDLRGRPAISAEMQRLILAPPGRGEKRGERPRTDPRRMLGVELTADEFGFGGRRLGELRATVEADPLGLELTSFETRSDSFTVSGSGGWFERPSGPMTRLTFTLHASDVTAALRELSLEPIASGEVAEITANVWWPDAPSGAWMDHLEGELALRLEDGSLLDIDPGAGRLVGLMSITALPRRLALDFRDVFNKGLVFDEVSGGFRIIDGNAYTNDLKVSGPAAEIGMAGRIGLRDRDYRQQAVVTAEPGNMLPTVGGLIGGPGVGAALLIFTRIFKEPLKGIGRASYCITGGWDEPVVERLTAEEIEQGRLCADLPQSELARSGEGR